jgi:hypothetical protein
MAILTADLILKEVGRKFDNKVPFLSSMTRSYDDSYKAYGAKGGESIRIMKPTKKSVGEGKTLVEQDINEESVTLTKATQLNIGLRLSSKELTMDMENLSALHLEPAAAALASKVERTIANTVYKQIYNTVALPVTAVDRDDVLNASTKLNQMEASGKRFGVISPKVNSQLVSGNASIFNPQPSISRQYMEGEIGNIYGFDLAWSNNLPSHTTGTYNGAHVIDGASQTGSTLVVKTGTGAPTAGDVFTIADVYGVNPVTLESTGELQQFVVGSGATATSWPITPALSVSGNTRTVTALPADGAAITEVGVASTVYPQQLFYTQQAFAFGVADLELPGVSKNESRMVTKGGMSMRLIKDYSIQNDDCIYRLDCLFGVVTVSPEFACRVYGV